KETSLVNFLANYANAKESIHYFADILNFTIDSTVSQRDAVTLGRIIARVISFQFVLNMNGFNSELVDLTRQHMATDIAMFAGQYLSKNISSPIFEYQENADWTNFA